MEEVQPNLDTDPMTSPLGKIVIGIIQRSIFRIEHCYSSLATFYTLIIPFISLLVKNAVLCI